MSPGSGDGVSPLCCEDGGEEKIRRDYHHITLNTRLQSRHKCVLPAAAVVVVVASAVVVVASSVVVEHGVVVSDTKTATADSRVANVI